MTRFGYLAAHGRLAAVAVVATGLLACGRQADTAPAREPRTVSALTPELAPVVDGNNAFAWSLYGELRHDEGNVFLSPLSIYAALGMTYAGARGQTADEMRATLQIGTDDASFHHELGALIRDLDGEHPGRGYELGIANRVFGQQGYPFVPEFVTLTNADYGSGLAEVDFVGDTEGARSAINTWVAEQTRDKVPELLEQNMVGGDTRMVLANAIYFKAGWAERFDVSTTHDATFTRSDGSEITVKMMSQKANFRYSWSDELSVLELDYQDDEVSMVLLLPAAHDGLADLEATLTRKRVDQLIAELHEQEVSVSVPRWEMSYSVKLHDPLIALGMPTAFTQLADFSGIADLAAGGEPLCLCAAPHKAYVKVDEEGTEAAAATGLVLSTTCTGWSFMADHPFVYLIRDRLTNSILFLGRTEDPTDQGEL